MKRMNARNTRWTVAFLCVFAAAGYAVKVWANPAVGVTATLIGRSTYKKFQVDNSENQATFQYSAQASPAVDMIVQTHDYAPGSSTGWHQHPGPVFISVLKGSVAFYEVDDPTCTPHVVSAGQGYVDTGHGHTGLNQSAFPAQDVTVAIAPVGGAFRTELPAPGPYCTF